MNYLLLLMGSVLCMQINAQQQHIQMKEEQRNQQIFNIASVENAWDQNALMRAASRLDLYCIENMARSLVSDNSLLVLARKQDIHGYTALTSVLERNVSGSEEMVGDSKRKHRAIIKYLLDNFQSDVNVATKTGLTPLMLAVGRVNEAAAQLLIEHGASVNMQDQNGTTALMIAAYEGSMPLVTMLLQAGAQKGIRDRFDKRAFDFVSNNLAMSHELQCESSDNELPALPAPSLFSPRPGVSHTSATLENRMASDTSQESGSGTQQHMSNALLNALLAAAGAGQSSATPEEVQSWRDELERRMGNQ